MASRPRIGNSPTGRLMASGARNSKKASAAPFSTETREKSMSVSSKILRSASRSICGRTLGCGGELVWGGALVCGGGGVWTGTGTADVIRTAEAESCGLVIGRTVVTEPGLVVEHAEKPAAARTRSRARRFIFSYGLERAFSSRTTWLAFVREQPFIKLGIFVGFRPGIVAGLRIDGEFHVLLSGFFQCVHHALRFLDRHHGIFSSMESPDAERLQRPPIVVAGQNNGNQFTAPANRRDGGKLLRVAQAQAPRAITAHAQAGEINSPLIHRILAGHMVEQRQQLVIGPVPA